MVKAVIFDCFGVLTTDGWKQVREEFFAQDKELLHHSLDIDRAVNVGMMDYDEFLGEISKMSGLSIDEARARMNGSAPNKILFDYIRDELKGKFKIGMLSNAADNWLTDLFEPWQIELFDEIVLSYEVGTTKPDPVIYQMMLQRLGVMADESIFIDDSERYCTAAEEQSMKAIWHQDTHDTIAKIKELTRA